MLLKIQFEALNECIDFKSRFGDTGKHTWLSKSDSGLLINIRLSKANSELAIYIQLIIHSKLMGELMPNKGQFGNI